MSSRTKLLDIELSLPIETIANLEGYKALQGLVRLQGTPLGLIYLPVRNGCCPAHLISQAITDQHLQAIAQQFVFDRLSKPNTDWQVTLLRQPHSPPPASLSVTVALCVQAGDATPIADCLAAIGSLSPTPHEVLVVESAPQSETLAQIIASCYPQFRYFSTPAGFNAARNLAIAQTQGDVIAFTDAHSIVDAGWTSAIACAFDRNVDAIALTGFVVPDQLETTAQHRFEVGYGLGRGYNRRRYHLSQAPNWTELGVMQLGAGVNMAFRRTALKALSGFDENLDAIGGEYEMFCRVLLSGQTLIYEPSAIARYRAPLTEEALHAYIQEFSAGFFTYLKAAWRKYPQYRRQIVTLGGWKLARSIMLSRQAQDLARSELQGSWRGWRSTAANSELESIFESIDSSPSLANPSRLMAVRQIDLSKPLPIWTDLSDYQAVRVFVIVDGAPIGSIDIHHNGQIVSVGRLQHHLVNGFMETLLAIPHQQNQQVAWAAIETALRQAIAVPPAAHPISALPPDLPVTVVITTCDRPDDLRNCLTHLLAQQTQRPIEIIVADNRPHSNLTPPVIAEFPAVRLVQEARPGGSYGRNAAIAASTSEIIITIDDDITVPPDWLEKLIAPLARSEVAIVTGNVLPRELETPAQILFERLPVSLSQGLRPFEADGMWLASYRKTSPPTWDLGVSSNAAYRASIFAHPQIGLMDEVLGPGTPTSGGEETYLIYKILKAGGTLVYQPQAYAWHRHRREMSAFYRQLHGYLKSATAYNLTLWLQEGDRRGLWHLVWQLPRYYVRRIRDRLSGRDDAPWALLWHEISGYFAGYWGYWQSWQLVKRQGRSDRYIPVSQRSIASTLSETPKPEVVKAHGS